MLFAFLARHIDATEWKMTVGMPLHHFGGDGIIETAAVGDVCYHPLLLWLDC